MTHAVIQDYLSELIGADDSAATSAMPAAPPAASPAAATMAATATAMAPATVPPPVPAALAAVAPSPLASVLAMVAEEPATPARRAHERATSWLRFRVASQHFAVEVLKVQEVLRVPEVVPVRGAPDCVSGLMNMRGQLVAIIDLARRLALPPAPPPAPEEARVVVLEENGVCLGLAVDAVADVAAVTDAAIETIHGPLLGAAGDILRGIARLDGAAIVLLDAGALLESRDS